MLGLKRSRPTVCSIYKISFVAILVLAGGAVGAQAQTVWYVDDDAPLGGDGANWSSPFKYLQDALAVSTSGDEIHIAAGVYTPDRDEWGLVAPGDREAAFEMKNGVAIRGGYAGLGASDPDLRDINSNATILSADLDGDDGPLLIQDFAECLSVLDDMAVRPGCEMVDLDFNGRVDADDFVLFLDANNFDENAHHVFHHSSSVSLDDTAVLEGCRIAAGNSYCRNGRGGGICNDYCGPGPSISSCTIVGNTAWYGGGLHNRESSPLVSDCIFIGNISKNSGGGIYDYGADPIITGSTFSGNAVLLGGLNGGGITNTNNSDAQISDCTFNENEALWGGGVANQYTSRASISRCVFTNNHALEGGGVNDFETETIITGCVFRDNTARSNGGGIATYSSGLRTSISNCLFVDNTAQDSDGGAINSFFSVVAVTNCTLTGNWAGYYGGGICHYGTYGTYGTDSGLTIENTILWDNAAVEGGDQLAIMAAAGAVAPSISHSNLMGGHWDIYLGEGATYDWGAGNLMSDPQFVYDGDRHLMPESPCIDAGTNDPTVGLPANDLEGNPRLLDGDGDSIAKADMGAYELDVATPSIAVSSYEYEFLGKRGEASPPDQTAYIRNCGGGTLEWQLSGQPVWLNVSPSYGDSIGEEDEIVLSVDSTSLEHGSYTAVLQVTSPVAVSSPREIVVTLHVADTLSVPSQYQTIRSAINASVPGDEIVLADMTYAGVHNKNLELGGKAITLRSASGDPARCIIDCEGSGRGFHFRGGEGRSTVLKGLTITNGVTGSGESVRRHGGGVLCEYWSHPTLIACNIVDNSCVGLPGGGLACSNSNPRLVNCTISENNASRGGGIYCVGSSPELVNCLIADNSGVGHGGGVYGMGGGNLEMANCTIVNNHGWHSGGVYCTDGAKPVIRNSILWWNSGRQLYFDSGRTISCSNIQGGVSGVVGMDADPQFVSASDFRLTSGSPCINAGDNGYVPADVNVDLDGEDRIRFCHVDIGAYEWGIDCSYDLTSDCNTNCIPDECELDCNDNGQPDECDIAQGSSQDCNGNGVPDECDQLVSGVIYVDDDAVGGLNNGSSWENAYVNLQDAIAHAMCADVVVTEIHVAAGTYYPDQGHNQTSLDRDASFGLVEGVAFRGGYAGLFEPGNPDDRDTATYPTVLSGDLDGNDGAVSVPSSMENDSTRFDNSRNVVESYDVTSNAVLDGFVITGGHGDSHSGYGAGVYNRGSALIIDCTFSENYGAYGAALISVGGAPTISNCTFTRNCANGSGAAIRAARGTITNCVFTENSAGYSGGAVALSGRYDMKMADCTFSENSAEFGGAIRADDAWPIISRCTITNNTASACGGGIYTRHTVGPSKGAYTTRITNCVLAGNGALHGGAIFNSHDYPTVSNCVFAGNQAEERGGAVYNSSGNLALANCTFADNDALYGASLATLSVASDSVAIDNCVFWDDYASPISYVDSSSISMSHSDIRGGWTGTGNVDSDPLFVDPDGLDDDPDTWQDNDYRLTVASPCLNAGSNGVIPADTADLNTNGNTSEATPFDLDGLPRVISCVVDMGAYENQTAMLGSGQGDYNGDCSIDLVDYGVLEGCLGDSGPEVVLADEQCVDSFDFDDDGDVDLADFAGFQTVFTGGADPE